MSCNSLATISLRSSCSGRSASLKVSAMLYWLPRFMRGRHSIWELARPPRKANRPVRIHFSACLRLPLIFSGFVKLIFFDYFDFSAMRADNKAGSSSGRHRPLPSEADPKGISDNLPRSASPSCSSRSPST